MELSMYQLLVAFFINRMVELFKQTLDQENPIVKRWHAVWFLFASFVIGALAMVAVFPNDNLFPTAATPLAGLIVTGIVVGGFANGWDFVGVLGGAVINRISGTAAAKPKTNVTVTADSSNAIVREVEKSLAPASEGVK